jgi:3-oxoacyl-[acyl-carrier-protein] synthase II
MIAGGVEDACNPFCYNWLNRTGAVCSSIEDPKAASRPFDDDRDGYIATDGASVVVLEEYEHAKARNAHIYCEVTGFGNASDGAE